MARTKQNPTIDPDVQKLRRHVRILGDLGRLAGENHSVQRFLDQAVVQVARAVEIDHVKVMRYRREASDLLMVAGMGWKEGLVRSATFSTDMRSPPGRSFQTAEPVVINDLEGGHDFQVSPVLREHGIVSLANVPVLMDGAAWGVLEVDSSTRRDFSEDTIDFMSAAAAIIGAMVQQQATEQSESEIAAVAIAQAKSRQVLLREMQHRVKNNFQVILSSISIQKRRFSSEEVQRVLDHVTNRINAVSLAHDQLAPRDDQHAVNVASYLRALCNSIEQQVDRISIEVEADDVVVGIDRAVALGLIVNESVTNSVKHAFSEAGGQVLVRLTAGVGYGEARLSVSDNGRGIQEPNPGGSGLKLINSLARQIGGSVEHGSSSRGTMTTVTFPAIA